MTHPGIFFSKDTWNAKLALAYGVRDRLTVPTLREHHGPLRIQKGFRAEAPHAPHIWHQYLLHPPGGIAQGDRLQIDVSAGPGAHVLLTTPGATKWYRADADSSGAQQQVNLRVHNAVLEWLPQETIYFSGAKAFNDLQIRTCANSTVFCAEVFSLGRPASEEVFLQGNLRLRTQLWIDDQIEFSEQAQVEGADAQLNSSSGMSTRPIMGQLIAYSPRCEAQDTDLIRTNLERELAVAVQRQEIDIGVTQIPLLEREGSFIILRCRSTKTALAWDAIRSAWSQLRPRWIGQAAVAPRIWST